MNTGDHGGALDILLIEDNPHDAELTMRAFKQRNLANPIVWLTDGAEAAEYLFGASADLRPSGSRWPRVILLDLKLPKVDGLELLRRIKNDEMAKLIPVVVLTSSREERDIVSTYALGANSYVVKPVAFEKFSDAVATLGLYWLLVNQPPPPASPK
jgi:two-component system response regulator